MGYESSLTAERARVHPADAPQLAATLLLAHTFLLRAGLERILTGRGFDVFEDANAFSNMGTQPALVIMEAAGSPSETVDAVAMLRRQYPDTRIAVLSDSFELSTLLAVREAGAEGFCSTASNPEILIKSLEMVLLGELVIPSSLVLDLLATGAAQQAAEFKPSLTTSLSPAATGRVDKLSPREADVLRCLMTGSPNKVIARQFDVAEATVKVHVKAILRKIGASNRTQAALWAADHMAVAPRAYADA